MTKDEPTSRLGHLVDEIEETCIALCLGLMTLITFANVIASKKTYSYWR